MVNLDMNNLKKYNNSVQGLYRPEFEHDNCGIGAVVNIKGKKSHQIVADALKIVENLEHRAGKDAEGETGDGVRGDETYHSSGDTQLRHQ